MDQRKWWSVGIAVVVGVACSWSFVTCFPNNLFATVPPTRDTRLVGTWSAPATESRHASTVTYFPDGTARTKGWGTIKWGTANGVLYMKFRSAGEGFVFEQHPFALSNDSKTVSFGGNSLFLADRMVLSGR